MMSLAHLGLNQRGGYVRGQKEKTDTKGNKIYIVYTHVGDERLPFWKDTGDLKEMKTFRGKSPKETAKKVVTEICQSIQKSDPSGYKKNCRPMTSSEITKREKELMSLENIAVKDPEKASKQVDWSKFRGFKFELQDTMNTTSDGQPRRYFYYGERVKLDTAKKFKDKKFSYESYVYPIRKDYTLTQAMIDHIYKSKEAKKRETKNQNFSHHRRKTSVARSKSKSKTRSRSSSRKRTTHQKLMSMTPIEVGRKCQKGKNSWKVADLDKILTGLKLSKEGSKADKCQRVISYYKTHRK